MYDINDLIVRAINYAVRAGITESTVSFKIFGSGNRLSAIISGESCRVNTAARAWKRLDELEGRLDEKK